MLSNYKTLAIVDAGILASIAIMLALITSSNPTLGIFLAVFWPVPFIVLGVKHNLKISCMALTIASVFTLLLANPVYSLSIVIGFSLIAVALVYSIKHNFSLTKTLCLGITASILSKCIVFATIYSILGFNPVVISDSTILQSTQQLTAITGKLGIPTYDGITKILLILPQALETINYLLPTGFVIASITDTTINYIMSRIILTHTGVILQPIPDFKTWQMPRSLVWVFIISSTYTIYMSKHDSITANIFFNMYILSSVLLIVQTISCIFFFANNKSHSFLIKNIALFIIFTNPIVGKIATLFGIYDLLRNPRKLGHRCSKTNSVQN